jgi:hypothetical protein
MRDTSPDIRKKQAGIILAKSEPQRNEMGFEMIDSVYAIVKNSILEKNPGLRGRELIVEIFKRYYANDFSEDEVKQIVQGILIK